MRSAVVNCLQFGNQARPNPQAKTAPIDNPEISRLQKIPLELAPDFQNQMQPFKSQVNADLRCSCVPKVCSDRRKTADLVTTSQKILIPLDF